LRFDFLKGKIKTPSEKCGIGSEGINKWHPLLINSLKMGKRIKKYRIFADCLMKTKIQNNAQKLLDGWTDKK
jgi:hypothetical protein